MHSSSPTIKRTKLLFVLFSFFVFPICAQKPDTGKGIISGIVTDSVTGQPVDYATISLLQMDNEKVVNGTTTDPLGNFEISGLENGTYKLQVYFIGYKAQTKNDLVISDEHSVLQLPPIRLSGTYNQLKTVEVGTEKSLVENKIDKMVYNVSQDISSQSGSASDVLSKVPQVSVDIDGKVELQGNSSIKFLINGKPSVIFGNNIAEVLQSIPANQIESIEIITSPGAKYDAEGTGGIINIILKKNTTEGFNGNISLSAGTRLENGSLNLNAHKKHFGVNAFFSGNAMIPSVTPGSSKRVSHSDSLTNELLQESSSLFSRKGFESGIGFEWEAGKHSTFSGSMGYDYFDHMGDGTTTRQFLLSDAYGNILSDKSDKLSNSSTFKEQSLDWELSYTRTFKKEDRELEIACESSNGNNYNYYKQSQSTLNDDSVISSSYGKNPGMEKETIFSIDYVEPLAEDVELEVGAKATLNNIESSPNVYVRESGNNYLIDPEASSSLRYRSNVYGAYTSASFELFDGALEVKAGFRYEYTETHAFFSQSGNVFVKPYPIYVPSLVISHSFEKNLTLKLSYSHRVERPDYEDLNPFVDASDPQNLRTGNTALKPETGDKAELGLNKTFKNGMVINSSLFFRGNKNDIQSYTHFYPLYTVGDTSYRNVSVSTRENIGRENNFGLNVYVSVPLNSKISLRSNISFFQRYIINGTLPGNNVQGFNYRINANGSYQISNTFAIEMSGNFNSPRVNAQGKMPSFSTYNFAFRKQFFNKKLSIAFTATNAFNKYIVQKTELQGADFTLDNVRKLPYRSFGINLTYKFGKLQFKDDKEPEDMNLSNPGGAN